MAQIAYVPLTIGGESFSTQVNGLFSPLYSLFGYTGSPGTLDSTNFGNGGINSSQINAGTFANNSTAMPFAGNINAQGGLVIGGISGSSTDIALSGYLGFAGNVNATIDYNITSANTLTFKSQTSTSPAALRGYTNSVVGGFGSFWSALNATGTQAGNSIHAVSGHGTISASTPYTLVVPLTGAAQFTSQYTYCVIASAINGGQAVEVLYTSGSSFTIYASSFAAGSTVSWLAIGY